MRFYSNRELSHKFGINLAKWKRWSREFLPPDPLGGLQSGYARQYSIDDAFKVFLGGHLVAELRYTIPEARTILQDLWNWLQENAFNLNVKASTKLKESPNGLLQQYIIYITRQSSATDSIADFHYTLRGIVSNRFINYKGLQVREDRYLETLIPPRNAQKNIFELPAVKMLNISAVVNQFVEVLGRP